MHLLQLLREGKIQEFNDRRGSRVTLDFFAADLAGRDLSGVDFSGANLEKADLSGCNLTGAILAKATLIGADLTGAVLDRCVAVRVRLREAYLGEAQANGAEFGSADFSEADLTGFRADGARFTSARFKGTTFTKAVLRRCDFSEARFSDADLRGADLTESVFSQAELARADLSGATATGAVFRAGRLGGAIFNGAALAGAQFAEADLSAADFTGADVKGADFRGADLFDAKLDPGALGEAPATAPAAGGLEEQKVDVDLRFEDPQVVWSGGVGCVVWENADSEEVFALRVAVFSASPRPVSVHSVALRVATESVLARGLVPIEAGFAAAFFIDRPGGVELVIHPITLAGVVGEPKSVRLGYVPVVKPVFVPDEGGFIVYGIGRHGALSAHRWDGTQLAELMRAPAGTYRGFCGRRDPVLLGKGGTLATVRRDGIGRLLSAPASYPGRLSAAAYQGDGEPLAVAWTARSERGFRFQVLGTDVDRAEATRIDAAAEIASLDLAAVGDQWLAVWVREPGSGRTPPTPMGAWLPGGRAFPLLEGEEVSDVRIVVGQGPPRAVMVTADEELRVVEIGAADAQVVARLG